MVQAKAPAGANGSTTSGLAARMLDAKTPPAPYYHDTDGGGIGDACEAPVVSDPALTGASAQGASQPNGARLIRAGRTAAPALPLVPIHPSAWKVRSPKSASKIAHKTSLRDTLSPN